MNFSVRDADDAPRATVEYRLVQSSEGLPELKLIQQKGPGNTAPKAGCHGMLELLESYFSSPVARMRLLKLAPSQRVWQAEYKDIAGKYARSLEFIRFLEEEGAGRLDLAESIAKVATPNDVSGME